MVELLRGTVIWPVDREVEAPGAWRNQALLQHTEACGRWRSGHAQWLRSVSAPSCTLVTVYRGECIAEGMQTTVALSNCDPTPTSTPATLTLNLLLLTLTLNVLLLALTPSHPCALPAHGSTLRSTAAHCLNVACVLLLHINAACYLQLMRERDRHYVHIRPLHQYQQHSKDSLHLFVYNIIWR